MASLPSGTVTFLFTDLEGSTRLWQQHPDAMRDALARHDDLVRRAIEGHGGYVVKTTGDGFHAAFATAHDAVDAAVAAQLLLSAEEWTTTGPLRVRMGLHTCEAEVRDGDYYGVGVNRAARLMSVAHGGQIVSSAVTSELVRDRDAELVDLGEHRLRDLAGAEHIFEVRAPGLASGFPPLLSLDAFPGNLPARQTSFVGRTRDLEKLADALRTSRLVTLTGVGGVGKTRLALQAAAQLLPDHPGGAWCCELAAADSPEAAVQVVAAAVGAPSHAGMDLVQNVVEHLRDKDLLLLLDNCEHVLDAAAALAQAVVESCPEVSVLATSREGLAVDGEQLMAVGSLGLPTAGSSTLADLAASDAVRLFVDRARSVHDAFVPTAADAAAIAEICRRLDGIPLAIELAAARTVAMAPSEIAELLDERFRLLAGGRRSAVERHQTLRATVEWSYGLLEVTERQVFDRLAVFTGSFDATDATAVVSGGDIERFDVLDALTGLVAKSMVTAERRDDGRTRYQLLETLRHFARERLEQSRAIDEWRCRHATHYTSWVERVAPDLFGRGEIKARARIVDATDNLRAAFTWAMDRTEPTEIGFAFRIVSALSPEAAMRRSSGVGAWAERALERDDVMSDRQRFDARNALAWDLFQRGKLVEARALALATIESGAPPGSECVVQAYQCAAATSAIVADLDVALPLFEEALEIGANTSHSDYWRAAVFAVRSLGLGGHGRQQEAESDARQALDLARRIGNPTVEGLALQALGYACWFTAPADALAALEEAIELMASGAIEGGVDATLARVAPLRQVTGDDVGAVDALLECVSHMQVTGERLSMVTALESCTLVLGALGRDDVAAVLHGVWSADTFGPSGMLHGAELERHLAAVERVRAHLGADAFDRATRQGARMSDAAALDFTLDELTRIRQELAPP